MIIIDENTKVPVKIRLSLLWIFLLFNYIYADIFKLFEAEILADLAHESSKNSINFNQGFFFAGAVIIEIPIVMFILSRVSKYKINRRLNIIAGILMTFVISASMFLESGWPPPYYIFFTVIEIATTLFIVRTATKWQNQIFN